MLSFACWIFPIPVSTLYIGTSDEHGLQPCNLQRYLIEQDVVDKNNLLQVNTNENSCCPTVCCGGVIMHRLLGLMDRQAQG